MKDAAYLFVHGFAGSLREIEYPAQFLRSRGLDVYTVLLSGHGGTKKDLRNSSYPDWIDSVSDAVEALRKKYKQIVLLGFSMGGLLILHFAHLPEVKKLVLINTPIYYWNLKVIFKDIISGLRHRQFEKIRYYRKSLLGSSVKSGVDFLKLLSKSKKLLKNVSKPVLIIQCENDETVRPKSARYLADKLSGAVLREYCGGRHNIFNGENDLRDKICGEILRFWEEG
jgi:carboxylesterase